MDSEFFTARVDDAVCHSARNKAPKFLGFLTPQEAAIADSILKKQCAKYLFYGGYGGAERQFLACLPDWCDNPDFPIVPLTFRYRVSDKLSHRDFLGSLMALGITRESVGDILVEDGRAVVFVTEDVLRYITEQITKIGKVGVTVTEGFSEPLPSRGTLADFTVTAASLRLDCAVAALTGVSRSRAAELIENDLVFVNSLCCNKLTKCISDGDKITVRGRGKYIIDAVSEHTRKGRVIINFKKYI